MEIFELQHVHDILWKKNFLPKSQFYVIIIKLLSKNEYGRI